MPSNVRANPNPARPPASTLPLTPLGLSPKARTSLRDLLTARNTDPAKHALP